VEVELIRGGGGDFIVIADGREIWNKRRQGDQFPETGAILAELRR
jgi:predicted Rdx family selenoprotein